MLSTILDIILDALLDSAKMLPFLYLTFLLMEFIEHHAADKLALALEKQVIQTSAELLSVRLWAAFRNVDFPLLHQICFPAE